MECPATKRRKLEGGVFREVEFDKCFTLGREDFPDLDSDTLKNVSEQHVVLTDASWDHFTGYNMLAQPRASAQVERSATPPMPKERALTGETPADSTKARPLS